MNTDTNKEIPAKSLQPTIWSVWMNESTTEIDRNRARERERDRQPSAHTAKIHRDIALAANRKPFITYNVHTFPKFIVFWFFQIKTNWNVVKFIDHRANTMNMAPRERYGMAQFFSLPFICTIRTYRSMRQRYISVRRILFSLSLAFPRLLSPTLVKPRKFVRLLFHRCQYIFCVTVYVVGCRCAFY